MDRKKIERDEHQASVRAGEDIARQCLNKPTGESEENLALMRLIDEQYLRTPFYGVPKMTHWLRKQGHAVNPKRVRRLMRVMGLEAIYPKRRLSRPAPGHRIYPYRLRELAIVRPNQVWATDITYIRLRQGFVYLVAIMDWFSRYVLAWEVSNSMDTGFCLSALDWALKSAQPEIFNSDQGAQFTSEVFTRRLEAHRITISMDGRGRVIDRTSVVECQVRRGLLARLHGDARCHRWSGPVLCLLQPGTQSSVPGVPDARSGLLRKYGLMGPKRTMLRIDRGGDRRLHAILARFFSAPVRSVVENATLVGIRKEHGFPQVFGKASQKTLGFPTFFTTPTARTITHQFEAVGIQLRLADFLSKEWGDPPVARQI